VGSCGRRKAGLAWSQEAAKKEKKKTVWGTKTGGGAKGLSDLGRRDAKFESAGSNIEVLGTGRVV